jgi:TRAP-type mannitol/chloroaromatic compound transport system permease small subunit
MRDGDRLILACLGLSLILVLLDGITGGSVAGWSQENLPGIAHMIGLWAGRIGLVLAPLVFLPLITGILGRFIKMRGLVWTLHERLIRLIETVTRSIGGAARWFALGLVVVTALIVVQRYVFGFASTKLQESVIYMHALLFLLASASALLSGGHVRVDVFYSKASDKAKAWIDLFGTYLALIPMSALILWSSTGYMASAWRILERSRESDGLPFVFLLKTAIPLFAILMIIQGVAMAARAAMTLADQKTPELPASLEADV